MPNDQMGFCSQWALFLANFVREKRTCGFKYKTQRTALLPLDRMWCEPGAPHPSLSRVWAERFIAARPGEAPSCPPQRASLWRQLAQYGLRQGKEAYIPPTHSTPLAPREIVPYIYSRSELKALFATIDQHPYASWSPRLTFTMPVLFRLLYGAGLRLGEALSLRHGDFDTGEGVITIHQGKNQKDRLVPVAPAVAKRLATYCHRFPGMINEPIFLSPVRQHALSLHGVESLFLRLLKRAGLPPRQKKRGPRIHDLRHTFAVHRLEKWYLAKENLEAKIPLLSAYMGHKTLRDTYYYLRITSSFFPEIAHRLEAFTGDVIPKGAIT